MGQVQSFEREKLIIGIIYHDKDVLDRALSALTEAFGEIEDVSTEFSFSREYSSYYDGELGGEGMRRIYSFRELIEPQRQSEIKLFTNSLEERFSVDGNRRINLDPGFISHGRLLLSTTKPTGFRIPLQEGIYAELTLFWARGKWQKLPWTYRDYQSELVQKFITKVRRKYLNQRKNNES